MKVLRQNNYRVLNIYDVLDSEILNVIEKDIMNFKSKNNDDVENFIKMNAINFCKLKQSVTYLLYDDTNSLKGYYTLAFKIMDLPIEDLSNSLLKKLERFGQRKDNFIQVPGILLAQWSKNFSEENVMLGTDLLSYVEDSCLEVQRLVGGSFSFVECESEKKGLVSRYKDFGFSKISERISTTGKPLYQFIKKI